MLAETSSRKWTKTFLITVHHNMEETHCVMERVKKDEEH